VARSTLPRSPEKQSVMVVSNGLLRQYFPKGTDLSMHSVDALAAVAATLNGRPRRRWDGEHLPRLWTSL